MIPDIIAIPQTVDNPGIQLPDADVAQRQLAWEWPDFLTRYEWAVRMGKEYNLPRRERAVLNHVCYRAGRDPDGKPPWCWESAANIGEAIDYHRTEVSEALTALVKKGLLIRQRRYSKTTKYRPTLIASICREFRQMDVGIPDTNPEQ